ncbi:fibronectin type III-like domain-contianing protein [Yeosuana sp.]|uniref:fibronectin type III-like domain-contianing protein n=1 Tax=Yeosuana sp. TaxID=2529388 RepID=UPI004054FC47
MQLYIKDKFGSITRPVKELKGFKKINLKKEKQKQRDLLLLPTIKNFMTVI